MKYTSPTTLNKKWFEHELRRFRRALRIRRKRHSGCQPCMSDGASGKTLTLFISRSCLKTRLAMIEHEVVSMASDDEGNVQDCGSLPGLDPLGILPLAR